jgi:hypothetical protein
MNGESHVAVGRYARQQRGFPGGRDIANFGRVEEHELHFADTASAGPAREPQQVVGQTAFYDVRGRSQSETPGHFISPLA